MKQGGCPRISRDSRIYRKLQVAIVDDCSAEAKTNATQEKMFKVIYSPGVIINSSGDVGNCL